MTDGFIFYASWFEALSEMPPEIQLEAYQAISAYGCGQEVDLSTMNPWARSVLKTIIPQIDANTKRRESGAKGAEYGTNGGRPKKNPIGVIDENPIGVIDENPDGVTDETPKVKAKVKDKAKEKDNAKAKENAKAKVFIPPTVDEVAGYCAERGNGINAQEFIDYYEQSNWHLSNGQKMVDWKAAVRNWENRRKQERRQAPPTKPNPFTDYTHQTTYDWDAIEAFETANPVLKNYAGS